MRVHREHCLRSRGSCWVPRFRRGGTAVVAPLEFKPRFMTPQIRPRRSTARGDLSGRAGCPPVNLDLIGRIYSAALDPSEWPTVLQELAKAAGCRSLTLSRIEKSCSRLGPTWTSELPTGDAPTSSGIVTVQVSLVDAGDVCGLLSGTVDARAPRIEQINRTLGSFVRHLQHAIKIMAHIAESGERHDRALAALDRLPRAASVIVGSDGQVCAMSRAARRILRQRDGVLVEANHLTFADPKAAAAFRRACGYLARASAIPESITIDVRRRSGRSDLHLSLVPVSHVSAPAVLGHSHFAILIDDTEAPQDVEEQTLVELFRLTPMEARVAAAIAGGLGVQEAARNLDLSVPTLRWHLQHVFQKTGTARQAQLVSRVLRGVACLERG